MRTLPAFLLATTLFTAPVLSGCKRAHQIAHHATSSEPDYTAQLQANITPGHLDGLKYPDFTGIQAQVANLYDARDFDAVWIKGGKPTPQANAMLQEFSNASRRGLQPGDYDAGQWQARVTNLATPEGAALFDVAMTVNAMRFVSDLHNGRVDPAHFTFGVKGYDTNKIDTFATLNDKILDSSDVGKALDAVEPQAAQYAALKEALAHYLELAPQDNVEPLSPIENSAKPLALTAGYPGLQALQHRLALVGDLDTPIDSNNPPDPVSLTAALTKFQHRQGLNETGKLSHDTIEALNTPISAFW